ncbi:uncharacterized protein LOC124911704 [Impatiens glandulifera]|uniref:uncharacterized protein LOC124911704 n=1 Tax=Impatiens glandulifera TaxID=253017 RepID=UPI001FB071CE|nr:uncharacterized protein LOC124911704 [Impatiens glandulifera]
MGIMKETFRILLSKNGKLIAGVTSISTIIVSISLIFYSWATSILNHDLHAKIKIILIQKGLNFTHLFPAIKQDVGLFLVCLFTFKLVAILLSGFTVTATTLASSAAYSRKSTFTFKELMLKVKTSIMRPIITVYYINLINMGLVLLGLCIFGTLVLLIEEKSTVKAIGILIGILVWAVGVYWSVMFQLAMTISVMEDELGVCGIEAIGKAWRLVKGKWIYGFVINLIFETVSTMAIIVFARMSSKLKLVVYQVIGAVIVMIMIWVVRMFIYIFYTVLYFQCMKIHGTKMVGLEQISEYAKIPSFEHLP